MNAEGRGRFDGLGGETSPSLYPRTSASLSGESLRNNPRHAPLFEQAVERGQIGLNQHLKLLPRALQLIT